MKTSKGMVNFPVPGYFEPAKTWYQIIGDLGTSKVPLIVLHGGPGACHDYLLPLKDLADSTTLIFYDQIGNGRSCHILGRAGDEAFWSIDLFMDELDNLLTKLDLKDRPIDIYGHSWGGMLATEWAAKRAHSFNLRRLIIASSLANMDAWRVGITDLRNKLPSIVQDALDRAEETKNFKTPEYVCAMGLFHKRHLSLARPWPAKEVKAAQDWLATDTTTHETMSGPNKLLITGSLRDWTSIPFLHNIKVPTLLINGAQDKAQDVAMQPFFEHVPNVRWITLDNAAHFAHVDQREKYMEHLRHFLSS